MGHRGIYKVVENGRRAAYYTHWGAASPFSIFNRLQCARELKDGVNADKTLIDILAHMGDDGNYHTDAEHHYPMFEQLSIRSLRSWERDFENAGYLEMRVTLNMDTDTALIEHNPRYCHYKYVGNYFIPISQGLHNLKVVVDYAERMGIEDVREVADLFHRHAGMDEIYARATRLWEAEEEMDSRTLPPAGQGPGSTSAEFSRSSTGKEYDMER